MNSFKNLFLLIIAFNVFSCEDVKVEGKLKYFIIKNNNKLKRNSPFKQIKLRLKFQQEEINLKLWTEMLY
jgi:hypothetical protein